MDYCQNCGHQSHCGIPANREEKDYDGRIYIIKICDGCRCDNCKEKQNG